MTFWSDRFRRDDEDDIWKELRQMLMNPPTEQELVQKKKQEQAWIDSILNKAFPGVNEMTSSRDYKLESELKKGVNEMAGSRDYKLESKVKKEPYLTYEDLLDSVKDKKQILQNNNLEKELKPYADIESQADLSEAEKVQKRLEITKIQDLANAREKEITKEHNKEILKDVGGAAISMASAAVPQIGGAKLVGAISQKIAPIVGRKIANEIATGSLKGLSSGMVEGLGRGLLEDKNLLKTMAADGALGAIFGATGGAVGGNAQKAIRGNEIRNIKPLKDYTKSQIKDVRNKATNYYKDYIQGTVVKRPDMNNITFGNVGIDEVKSRNLSNIKIIPDLKKQIKTGIKKSSRYDYNREDISEFIILENTLNGKKYEYQIARDKALNKNKFYNIKDITNKQDSFPTGWNHNPGSGKNPNNIIPPSQPNLNPSNQQLNPILNDLSYPSALQNKNSVLLPNKQTLGKTEYNNIIPPSQPNLNPVTQQLNPIEKMVEELRRKRKNRGW